MAGGVRAHARSTRAAVALGADHRGAEDQAPARARAAPSRRASNTRMPGTDGGSVGISKTGAAEAPLQVRPRAVRVAQAEHRRERDALVAVQPGRELRRERGAEVGVVEARARARAS